MKRILSNGLIWLVLAMVSYIVGVIMMPMEHVYNSHGVLNGREEYTWTDSDGEEHEGQTLMSIDGVGRVLTYRDVYIMCMGIAFLFCLAEGAKKETPLLLYVKISNITMGIILIRLTDSDHIISTTLYWVGVLLSFVYTSVESNKKQSEIIKCIEELKENGFAKVVRNPGIDFPNWCYEMDNEYRGDITFAFGRDYKKRIDGLNKIWRTEKEQTWNDVEPPKSVSMPIWMWAQKIKDRDSLEEYFRGNIDRDF